MSLIFWYLPVAAVQFASARVTIGSMDSWYQNLEKGWWNPPSWLFGPVWTVLYALMAVAVWIVYQTDAPRSQKRFAYTLFFSQLAVNGVWSFLFFGLQMPFLAAIDLLLLNVLIVLTGAHFFRVRPLAGALFIPYLLWTLYALSLNGAIWWLNR